MEKDSARKKQHHSKVKHPTHQNSSYIIYIMSNTLHGGRLKIRQE
jgi:hypothetical protein